MKGRVSHEDLIWKARQAIEGGTSQLHCGKPVRSAGWTTDRKTVRNVRGTVGRDEGR